MFSSIKRLRNDEKFIMFIGILLTIFVFFFINWYFMSDGMIFFALVEAGIMWVVIIALLILADNQRVLNEEIKAILKESIKESRTLKDINKEQLQEIRLLKKAIPKQKK